MKPSLLIAASLLLAATACSRPSEPAVTADTPAAPAAPSAPLAAQDPFTFKVDVALSPAAAAAMQKGETIMVSASYFADPKQGIDPKLVNEVGQVNLGNAMVEIPGAGEATVDGNAVDRSRLPSISGEPQVNVNVFSGRHTSPDNLLDCDFFQDTVKVAAAKPVTLACKLIAEGAGGKR